MTDALYMADLASRYGVPETGVLAILAGCDVLEGPSNSASLSAITTAIKNALASGRLTQARIDLSVQPRPRPQDTHGPHPDDQQVRLC